MFHLSNLKLIADIGYERTGSEVCGAGQYNMEPFSFRSNSGFKGHCLNPGPRSYRRGVGTKFRGPASRPPAFLPIPSKCHTKLLASWSAETFHHTCILPNELGNTP